MKLITKVLGFGALAAGIGYLRRRAGVPVPAFDDLGISAEQIDDDLRDVATRSGIADIDPGPISHVAGEGIDLEHDTKAREELADLRDRLP